VRQQPLHNHPGYRFIDVHGPLQGVDDIVRYADFLRSESGQIDVVPVDLLRIHRHFGMPDPILAPLQDQQGLLFDSETGTILIKEDDPVARQRFTNAHELMEMLCEAHRSLPEAPFITARLSGGAKERLCDLGAAALLMPKASFVSHLKREGVRLLAGRRLATIYNTSLLATLFRMVEYGPGQHTLAVWRLAHKPIELEVMPSEMQPSLFGDDLDCAPPMKLRVWWARCTSFRMAGYLPRHKSIEDTSFIFKALCEDTYLCGWEDVSLGQIRGMCYVEAQPITIGSERCVVSLIHLPDDDGCGKGSSVPASHLDFRNA